MNQNKQQSKHLDAIKRLRSEAGYRSNQNREFRPRYQSVNHPDGRPTMTYEDYEKKMMTASTVCTSSNASASSACTGAYIGKVDTKELLDIERMYTVTKKK